MLLTICTLVGFCAIAGLATEAHAAPSLTDVRAAVDAGNAAYISAYRNSDPRAFAEIYDTNGARFGDSGDGSVTRGREAIADHVAKFINAVTGYVDVSITTQSLYVLDGLAYEEGKYAMRFILKKDGKAHVLAGQYVTVWKTQRDGGWKIYADMPVPSP
jgi:uncharacterized protein (TIGR02246 family)